MAAKLAVELVASEQFVPLLERNNKKNLVARWTVISMTSETRERMAQIEASMPMAAHCLLLSDGAGKGEKKRWTKNRRGHKRRPVGPKTTIWRPDALLRAFLDAAADALCRDACPSTSKDKPRKDNRELAPWELRWRFALTANDRRFESAGLTEGRLDDEIARWAAPVRPRATEGDAYMPAFQLELPGSSPESSEYPDAWYLRYLLQANDDPSILLDAAKIWSAKTNVIEHEGRIFGQPHETLLEALAETSRQFPPIARSLTSAKPRGVLLTTEEAWTFISSIGPIFHQFGMGIRVPRELRADGRQRLRLKLRVGGGGFEGVGSQRSRVGMSALAAFQWQVALGEHDLSSEEFREVAAIQQPLIQWRGQWLAVDPQELQEMQNLFARSETQGEMDGHAALTAALSGKFSAGKELGEVEVVAEGDLRQLVTELRNAETIDELKEPEGFIGELRPYQITGVTWLHNLMRLGMGSILADDMGLGKTIQVIALLLTHRERKVWGDQPALLICPTSVIGNWERELKKFAPDLKVIRHHGRMRAEEAKALRQKKGEHTVVLTTYVLARLDNDMLGRRTWSHLILDEAQNIKNPSSQQAIAIRNLEADRRIALTGTPIENRLTELWSILEFANPGLLGSLADFRRRFAVPIEIFNNERAAEQLRQMVNPFILRRVKSDPTVIQDLPDKIEQKVYCNLTREQAALYQAEVDKTMNAIQGSTGINRKANILALLTSLKQICNHPAHFLKDDRDKLAGRSGKLARLMELLEEVVAEGDRSLLFTQYKEMGDLLQRHIEKTLKVDVPFIHGGVEASARDRIVENFQNDPEAAPILLLSLKAGGTGLNLTRATHVFHYDRWWNPAVEDQATDRAYRLGQHRHVQVHKMVVEGTVEEKIDEILESKRSLASNIIGGGESWITELSDDELLDIFTLGGGSPFADEDLEGQS